MRLDSVANQNSGRTREYTSTRRLKSAAAPLRVTIEGMDDCAPPAHTHAPAGNMSGRTVRCVKFQKDMPGLDTVPWPGELGQRVFDNVSAQAWKLWEERQKM